MKPAITRMLLLLLLLLAIGGAGAQEAEEPPPAYPSFAEFCREAEEGSAARLTVEVLLAQVDEEACPMAGWRLNQLECVASRATFGGAPAWL